MTTMTVAEIAAVHADRTAKGAGFAPPLHRCLAAAAESRLYDVDTQNRGADCLTIADSETDALSGVAADEEPGLSAAHSGGASGWARERGWAAERITLARCAQ